MSFNPDTAEFYVVFNYLASATGESVAYLNEEYWYPAGLSVSIVVNGIHVIDMDTFNYTYENNYLSFDLSQDSYVHTNDIISLSITKKEA